MTELPALLTLAATAGVLALLLPFATHRSFLLYVALRGRRVAQRPQRGAGVVEGPTELPRVTVQLPVFNEPRVVERLIDATCRLDYPRDRLEIQLLDDSTDGTTARIRARQRHWRERGVRIEHIHRSARDGYKAGALAEGMREARGDFLLLLDADFVAPPDLILRLLPDFADPGVGMVQARWDHLNEDESWLTRAQALLLDGHFFFEQRGRFRNGCFMNFNGTAGMWRRSCLEDAGGWQSDTLTEDLDVSYRAQMRGWRFIFRDDVGVPAELPARAGSFEVQQKRWAQGGIQTARKLLPALLRGPWPLRVKREATLHLCGHLAHPLTLLLGLLIYPSALARSSLGLERLLFLDLFVFGAATFPFILFYGAAGRVRGRPWRRLIPTVVVTLAVGIGLTAPVSRAVLRGAAGRPDPFDRTPKEGIRGERARLRAPFSPRGASRGGDTTIKLLLGGTIAGFFIAAFVQGFYASMPFLALFAGGYLGMGIGGLGLSTGSGDRLAREEGEEGEPDDRSDPERIGPDTGLVVRPGAPVGREYEPA
jgi:cellulose synthase/poly-beta-1,6-N-acetylglucosamine synthase-like glycosyltransferase